MSILNVSISTTIGGKDGFCLFIILFFYKRCVVYKACYSAQLDAHNKDLNTISSTLLPSLLCSFYFFSKKKKNMVKLAIGSIGDSLSGVSIKSYLAEFIATLLFVFAGVGSAIAFSKLFFLIILVS